MLSNTAIKNVMYNSVCTDSTGLCMATIINEVFGANCVKYIILKTSTKVENNM
jgi:hypothetical protein